MRSGKRKPGTEGEEGEEGEGRKRLESPHRRRQHEWHQVVELLPYFRSVFVAREVHASRVNEVMEFMDALTQFASHPEQRRQATKALKELQERRELKLDVEVNEEITPRQMLDGLENALKMQEENKEEFEKWLHIAYELDVQLTKYRGAHAHQAFLARVKTVLSRYITLRLQMLAGVGGGVGIGGVQLQLKDAWNRWVLELGSLFSDELAHMDNPISRLLKDLRELSNKPYDFMPELFQNRLNPESRQAEEAPTDEEEEETEDTEEEQETAEDEDDAEEQETTATTSEHSKWIQLSERDVDRVIQVWHGIGLDQEFNTALQALRDILILYCRKRGTQEEQDEKEGKQEEGKQEEEAEDEAAVVGMADEELEQTEERFEKQRHTMATIVRRMQEQAVLPFRYRVNCARVIEALRQLNIFTATPEDFQMLVDRSQQDSTLMQKALRGKTLTLLRHVARYVYQPDEPAQTQMQVVGPLPSSRLCGHFRLDAPNQDTLMAIGVGSVALLLRGIWSSSSGSARRHAADAVMKVGRTDDLSLTAERYYYADLLPRLRHRSPHVVTAYVANCTVRKGKFEDMHSNPHIMAAWQHIGLPELCAALVLRQAPGITLEKLIREVRPKLSSELQNVLDHCIAIQLAQVLSVFETYHFRHNDLHARNVICQPLLQPFELPYSVGPGRIKVPWFVRVLDYGRASVDPNYGLANDIVRDTAEVCQANAECQTFVPNYDWHRIMATYAWIARDQKKHSGTGASFEVGSLISLVLPDTGYQLADVTHCELLPFLYTRTCVLDHKRLNSIMKPDVFLRTVKLPPLAENAVRALCEMNSKST